jgi:hypothetical protein
MLDKAGGGGDYVEDSGANGDFGSAGPAPRRQPGPAPAAAGGKSGDLNDEIPF